MLNRAAIIVRPDRPYLGWAASLDDSGMVPEVDGERNVYLIPVFDDEDEAKKILKMVFSSIFENELNDWHTDESAWPRDRSFKVFRKWFKIEMHSVVHDLCGYPFVKE